jgi:HSP20 family protein
MKSVQPWMFPAYLGRLYQDMQRHVNRIIGRIGDPRPEGETGPVSFDMRVRDQNVEVEARLPGFERDDVSVTLHEQVLRIVAERHDLFGESADLYDNPYADRIEHELPMPAGIDADNVSATFCDGRLNLVLPKRPGAPPGHVEIL